MIEKKRLVGKMGIAFYEELGFGLDLFRLPLLKKQQERAIRGSFRMANKIARRIGQEPKAYKRIIRRGIVEVLVE